MGLMILQSVANDFAQTQLLVVVVGIFLLLLVSKVPVQLYSFSPWPWYVVIWGLLLSTFIMGAVSHGVVRWITIAGVSIQTSELVKPAFILFIASYLTQYPVISFSQIAKYLVIAFLPLVLIILQPNLGTAILLLLLIMVGLVISGVPMKRIIGLLLVSLLILPIFFGLMKPYQRQRIESFISPTNDPLGSGYNSLQAKIAIGSGKVFGRGLGQGTQSHLRFLPERYSDFIFASLAEELGFLGGGLAIGLYVVLCAGLFQASKQTGSDQESIILLLAMALLMIQVFVNIGMNMGIVPITGITLPLLSAGGSSYISTVLILGICISIAKKPALKKAIMEIK
jgi:rod shape determining protein RodA